MQIISMSHLDLSGIIRDRCFLGLKWRALNLILDVYIFFHYNDSLNPWNSQATFNEWMNNKKTIYLVYAHVEVKSWYHVLFNLENRDMHIMPVNTSKYTHTNKQTMIQSRCALKIHIKFTDRSVFWQCTFCKVFVPPSITSFENV